ncbi:MAG TPA: hypothetical protein VMW35_16380 [Myxococcota bacterium]|jgi:hypothetical protein|nr:hypothetical protein [Myxococcota bacterium]
MSQTTLAQEIQPRLSGREAGALGRPEASWTPPRFEVISLDCEITAYAPEGDQPLF